MGIGAVFLDCFFAILILQAKKSPFGDGWGAICNKGDFAMKIIGKALYAVAAVVAVFYAVVLVTAWL